MTKHRKREFLGTVHTLKKANDVIKADYNRVRLNFLDILQQCQETAIILGTNMEALDNGYAPCVQTLEDYCEDLYKLSINREDADCRRRLLYNIQDRLERLERKIRREMPEDKKEVVFLPYKASMWDSLESVWKAAAEDEECDTYVIPIPYYDKNPDGSLGEMHYEGEKYPPYVPITKYDEYDFEGRRPDVTFIHNPYDNINFVTSIPPFYYSKNLKLYTETLVYIPYFVLDEINQKDKETIDNIKHFCTLPGVFHADKVIVQSENMRQVYVDALLECTGDKKEIREYWENKIKGIGSPKIEKVMSCTVQADNIPEEWAKIIFRPDGSRKKVILYNTGITALLQNNDRMLEKIKRVLEVFKEHRADTVLLWRPHPLIESTLKSMRPWLWESYRKIRDRYIEEAWGIYDDTEDMHRAVGISDSYYGDMSSVLQLYKQAGKPALVQNALKSTMGAHIRNSFEALEFSGEEIIYPARQYNMIFAYNRRTKENTCLLPLEEKDLSKELMYGSVCRYGEEKYLFAPMFSDSILLFDKANGVQRKIELQKRYDRCEDLFFNTVKYKNQVFLIPGTYEGIVIFDCVSEKVTYYDAWIREMENAFINKPYVYFKRGYGLIENFLYLAAMESNHIVKIDLETQKCRIIKINQEGRGFTAICSDGKNCWLACNNGNILKFHPDSENYDLIEKPSDISSLSNMPFIELVYFEGKVYAIPYNAEAGMEISVASLSWKYILKVPENETRHNFFCLCAKVCDSKLFMYSYYLEKMIVLDLVDGTVNYETIYIQSLGKEALAEITRLQACYRNTIGCFYEKYYNTLQQFIAYEGDKGENCVTKNECGKKIWKEITDAG